VSILKNTIKFIGSLFRRNKETSIQTKMVKVTNGNRTIHLTVQVADTPKKRDKGLMFVENLPDNAGMLFVFSGETYGGFWMKNTLIPYCFSGFRWENTKNTRYVAL
jgi:hypothetical protein